MSLYSCFPTSCETLCSQDSLNELLNRVGQAASSRSCRRTRVMAHVRGPSSDRASTSSDDFSTPSEDKDEWITPPDSPYSRRDAAPRTPDTPRSSVGVVSPEPLRPWQEKSDRLLSISELAARQQVGVEKDVTPSPPPRHPAHIAPRSRLSAPPLDTVTPVKKEFRKDSRVGVTSSRKPSDQGLDGVLKEITVELDAAQARFKDLAKPRGEDLSSLPMPRDCHRSLAEHNDQIVEPALPSRGLYVVPPRFEYQPNSFIRHGVKLGEHTLQPGYSKVRAAAMKTRTKRSVMQRATSVRELEKPGERDVRTRPTMSQRRSFFDLSTVQESSSDGFHGPEQAVRTKTSRWNLFGTASNSTDKGTEAKKLRKRGSIYSLFVAREAET